MLQIDERVADDRVAGFAEKHKMLSPKVTQGIEQMFLWEQETDFYYGQLASFIWCHQFVQDQIQKDALLAIIILICQQITGRKVVDPTDLVPKVDMKDLSIWHAVKDHMPPVGLVVNTKIDSDNMGEWCFIERFYQEGKWYVKNQEHAQFEDSQYDPTHWQNV